MLSLSRVQMFIKTNFKLGDICPKKSIFFACFSWPSKMCAKGGVPEASSPPGGDALSLTPAQLTTALAVANCEFSPLSPSSH